MPTWAKIIASTALLFIAAIFLLGAQSTVRFFHAQNAVINLPTLVSAVDKNSTGTSALGTNPTGQTFCANFSYCLPYAEPTLSGNIGIVSGHYANTTSVTVTATDDKSNSYTCVNGSAKDTGTNEWPFICYSPNLTVGTHSVTVGFSSTAVTQVIANATTFAHIATSSPLDGSIGSCAGASSTTANCASVTATAANDLIYVIVCRAGTPGTTSFTAGTGFTLSTADINDGCSVEYQVASGTGSITPSMTMATASTFIEIVAAFKQQASAGTLPTGTYVRRIASWSSISEAAPHTYNFQIISTEKYLQLDPSCGTIDAASISDSVNSWTSLGGSAFGSGPTLGAEFYSANATANPTGLISVTTQTTANGSTGDCTFTFYDVAGLPTSPTVAKSTIFNGVQSGASLSLYSSNASSVGNTPMLFDTFYSIPSNGYFFEVGGQVFNTTIGISSPSNCRFDSASYGGMSLSGPEQIDQNNSWVHCPVSSILSAYPTLTLSDSSTGTSGDTEDIIGIWSGTDIGILHHASNVNTVASSLAITIPSTTAGSLLVVEGGTFNSSTGGSISTVCLDGTTCAAGNAFTKYVAATVAGVSSSRGSVEVWYLLNAPAGKTTVTITLPTSNNNNEGAYYEVRKGNGGSWSIDGANTTTGTSNGTTGVISGSAASITTTGTNDFCISGTSVGGQGTVPPGGFTNSTYLYAQVQFNNTTDFNSALITNSASSYFPMYKDNSLADSFSLNNACFK